jgi:hypothetical protein
MPLITVSEIRQSPRIGLFTGWSNPPNRKPLAIKDLHAIVEYVLA